MGSANTFQNIFILKIKETKNNVFINYFEQPLLCVYEVMRVNKIIVYIYFNNSTILI